MENTKLIIKDIVDNFEKLSDSIVSIQSKGILSDENIELFNNIVNKLLLQVEFAIDNCITLPCEESAEDNSTITLEEWAANLNFNDDLQNNLNLFSGMTPDTQENTLRQYFDIVGTPELFVQIVLDAKASPDYSNYILNVGINLITELMTSQEEK